MANHPHRQVGSQVVTENLRLGQLMTLLLEQAFLLHLVRTSPLLLGWAILPHLAQVSHFRLCLDMDLGPVCDTDLELAQHTDLVRDLNMADLVSVTRQTRARPQLQPSP